MLAMDTNDVRELLEDAGQEPVLTLYLPLDPRDPANQRDAGTRSWQVQLRNDLNRLAVDADGQGQRRAEQFAAQRGAAEQWLASHQPGGRTLVLFVLGDRVIALELPILLRQRATFGDPAVGELARALSEHRWYAVVLVDGESARMLAGSLGFVDDVITLQADTRWGEPGPTRSEHRFRFEARREEYQHKHQYEYQLL